MEEKDRKTSRKASTTEVVRISQLLAMHLTSTGDGFYAYEDGWSDSKIIEEVAGDLSAAVAARIRRELYGDLRRTATTPPNLEIRVAKLEESFAKLAKALGFTE